MLVDNSELVKFIEIQVSKYPKPIHEPMLEIFVAAYAVLELQAQANNLSKFNSDTFNT